MKEEKRSKSSKNQLTLDFLSDNQPIKPMSLTKEEAGKVISFDPRQDIYKKILNRSLK